MPLFPFNVQEAITHFGVRRQNKWDRGGDYLTEALAHSG